VVKRLKQRIHTLRHDASEARKAFKYVEKIIEEMQLSDGQCEELGRLWQESSRDLKTKFVIPLKPLYKLVGQLTIF